MTEGMPMVIVKLQGGLGNQMFQYAVGRNMARLNHASLKLDVSGLLHDPLRTYQLGNFGIVESFSQVADLVRFDTQRRQEHAGRIWSVLLGWLPWRKYTCIDERDCRFDPKVLVTRGSIYLTGYFQSEKYFGHIAHILRRELQLKKQLSARSQAMAEKIANTCSISLHIRRGDYVSNPVAREVLGPCPIDYYHECISRLSARISDPHVFVFSDDMAWAKMHLDLHEPCTYVDHNDARSMCEDFALMTACQHHIIANSSFSWWAAWLGAYTKKIVCAPRRWSKDGSADSPDRIPDSWLTV